MHNCQSQNEQVVQSIYRNSTFARASHIACASSTKSLTAVARVTTVSVKDNGSISVRQM